MRHHQQREGKDGPRERNHGEHRDIAYRLERLTELCRELGSQRDIPLLLERILLTKEKLLIKRDKNNLKFLE